MKKDYITHAEYTADMFEVYKNFGVLVRRISELEVTVNKLKEENIKLKRGENK